MLPPELLLVLGLVFGMPGPVTDIAAISRPDTAPPQSYPATTVPPGAVVIVQDYPEASILLGQTNPSLSVTARQAWDEAFVQSSYFSAFAVAKDGGYGYATTANSPEAARDIALHQCLTVNTGCRVIAQIHPVGYTAPAPGTITISTEIAGYYAAAAANPVHRAMAVSADGSYAMVWGHASQAEADAKALSDCNGFRINDLPGLGDYPCMLLPQR